MSAVFIFYSKPEQGYYKAGFVSLQIGYLPFLATQVGDPVLNKLLFISWAGCKTADDITHYLVSTRSENLHPGDRKHRLEFFSLSWRLTANF